MENRRGEKIGWTGGWMGGFIWVVAISVVFFFQGRYVQALAGAVLSGIAIASVVCFSPWRFPKTPYWKLMLAPYVLFFLSAVWCVWSFGGFESTELHWWNMLWFLPTLVPFATIGMRKWEG